MYTCFDPRAVLSSLREVKCLFGVCEKFSEIVTIFSPIRASDR